MLLSAGLQINNRCQVVVLLTRHVHRVCSHHVEITRIRVQIVVPNLHSEHERNSWHRRDSVRNRVVGVLRGQTGSNDNLLEGGKNLLVKCDQKQDDDAERHEPSKKCSILRFFPVTKQFCGVEEVHFVEHSLDIAQESHESSLQPESDKI